MRAVCGWVVLYLGAAACSNGPSSTGRSTSAVGVQASAQKASSQRESSQRESSQRESSHQREPSGLTPVLPTQDTSTGFATLPTGSGGTIEGGSLYRRRNDLMSPSVEGPMEVVTVQPRAVGRVAVTSLSSFDFCTGDNSQWEPGLKHTIEVLAAFLAQHFTFQDCPKEALQTLKQLTELRLTHKGISDLTPFGDMTQLERLDLSYNEITEDPYPLWGLNKLNILFLSHNKIPSLNALAKSQALEMLDVSYNQLADVDVLTQLPHISWLNIAYNHIDSILPLQGRSMKLNFEGNPKIVTKAPSLSTPPQEVCPEDKSITFDPAFLQCIMENVATNPFFQMIKGGTR